MTNLNQRKYAKHFKNLKLFIITVAAWVLVSPVESESNSSTESANLILFNGVIATLNPSFSIEQAVAIRNHQIISVGKNQEVLGHQGPGSQLIDLQGRFLMPGFIEGHGHFMSLGRSKQIIDLSQAKSWEEIVSKVAIAVDSSDEGQWIEGRGWHQEKWISGRENLVDGVPTNRRLNQVAPNNPVILGHASGHAAMANLQALMAAKIDDTTPNPRGGKIVRDQNGTATGLLRETAQSLTASALAKSRSAQTEGDVFNQRSEQVELAAKEALRHGVTSFHDAGSNFATIDFYKKLEQRKGLPIRLYVMIQGEDNEKLESNLKKYYSPYQDNDFLTVRSIKAQLDGALGSHGAWLLQPYTDLPDSSGLVLKPLPILKKTAALAITHGFQLNTHAIGDRANREVLNLYEDAVEGQALRALRWRVEHAQHIHPIDVPRFGKLGVIAAVQGVHCTSDGPWIVTRLGDKRTKTTSYPWRDLIDTGAIVANGTDTPVESINPIASFYSSVSRTMNNSERFHPAQAMNRVEALKSYTINNAIAAFEEQHKGSIEIGKLADLVVLSKNLLEVPDDQILSTQVDLTIVGGIIKYQRTGSIGVGH